MKDCDVIRANERYRSVSRTLFQLGAALLAAAAVKLYNERVASVEFLLWSVVAVLLIWVGVAGTGPA